MEQNILEVNGLSKQFASFELKDINFAIPKGYIMGLIGPNGSGKTTIINLILNIFAKNSGDIKIFGMDNIKYEYIIKKRVGIVFDSNYFVDDWNVGQVEKNISMFYENWNSEKFNNLLRKFNIAADKKVKELSKGMQMKLMLACAFSYGTEFLILDEPTSGLDPVSRDELLGILYEYIEDGEHSVLFSTHITSDLEKIADYITYVRYGKQEYTGSKDEFIDMYRIAKGGLEDLTPELKTLLTGLRRYSSGFEGLIKTNDIHRFKNLVYENATIDDIVVFTDRRTESHE